MRLVKFHLLYFLLDISGLSDSATFAQQSERVDGLIDHFVHLVNLGVVRQSWQNFKTQLVFFAVIIS